MASIRSLYLVKILLLIQYNHVDVDSTMEEVCLFPRALFKEGLWAEVINLV
jgi:hypothetical protein